MRKPLGTGIAGVLAVAALIAAPGASASTEVGNRCVGNVATAELSPIGLGSGPGNPPAAVPSAGVITQWRGSVVPLPPGFPLSQALKVFRPTGAANQFQVVGESAQGAMVSGVNTFSTRITVQAGDRLGLSGSPGNLFCAETGNPGDVVGVFEGSAGMGSTMTIKEELSNYQVPVVAVVEADADGDGYGDETQDKCPQSAAVQVPCPVAVLSTSAGTVGKGLVKVLVTSNIQGAVTVGGTVKLGKGKTATLSGGTQVVLPGTIATFTLLFTQKLKAKLKTLSRKQRLTLNLTATAPNIVGVPSVSALSVKLKGQKKPKPKAKAKGK